MIVLDGRVVCFTAFAMTIGDGCGMWEWPPRRSLGAPGAASFGELMEWKLGRRESWALGIARKGQTRLRSCLASLASVPLLLGGGVLALVGGCGVQLGDRIESYIQSLSAKVAWWIRALAMKVWGSMDNCTEH